MMNNLYPYAGGFVRVCDAAKLLARETGESCWIYNSPTMRGWIIGSIRNWQANVIEATPDGHLRPFCRLVKVTPT